MPAGFNVHGSRSNDLHRGLMACLLLAALGLTACNPATKKLETSDATTTSTSPRTVNSSPTPSGGNFGTAKQDGPKESTSPRQDATPTEDARKITPEDRQRASRLVDKARDQLNDGQFDAGKESVANALMADPANESAVSFARQLDEDPAMLLSEATGDAAAAKSCDYVLVQGDTLSKIAERAYSVEWRKTLFVSLAKLNGIKSPKSVQPRQTIKVPALDCEKLHAKKPAPSTKPAQAKPPPTPSEPTGGAYQDGVKALNGGNKAKAFVLFKKAVDVDPSDTRAQASYRQLLQEREDWYRQCAASRTARNYKAAVESCRNVLAIDPNHEMAGRHLKEAERLLSAN